MSNRRKDKLIGLIKTLGFYKASKAVGTTDNLKKVTGIHTAHQFMELFLDLKPVESLRKPGYILYKNNQETNVFIYDKMGNDWVYFNKDLIFNPLRLFPETPFLEKKVTYLQDWLKTNYDLEVNKWDIHSFNNLNIHNLGI